MQRPAIVFVHGVRSSSALWDPQLAAVRAEGYEAVAVDLPGHGARRDERFTLPGAMAVLDEAVAGVGGGTGPVVIAGLSLGGYVTLEYAARQPARLVGVVASACTCDPHGKPVLLYRDMAHHVVLALGSVGAARAHLPRLPHLPGTRRTRPRPGTTAHVDGTDAPALLGGAPVPFRPGWDVVTDMLGQLAGRSAIENAARAQVPVWFVNGRRDHLRLDEKKYLAAVPHARLVVVPGSGHDVSSEAPDEYDAVLLGVLADLEAGRATHPGSVAPSRRPRRDRGRPRATAAAPAPGTVPNAAAV